MNNQIKMMYLISNNQNKIEKQVELTSQYKVAKTKGQLVKTKGQLEKTK